MPLFTIKNHNVGGDGVTIIAHLAGRMSYRVKLSIVEVGMGGSGDGATALISVVEVGTWKWGRSYCLDLSGS